MKSETLQRLVDAFVSEQGTEGLALYVDSLYEQEKSLRRRYEWTLRELKKENERHEGELKRIRQHVADIQEACSHYETTFQSDPSGGNGSSDTCDLCGLDVRRKR